MKTNTLSRSLAAALCCLGAANASNFKLDDSCTPAQKAFIRAGIIGANQMAAAALHAATTVNPIAAQQAQQIQLNTWLFGNTPVAQHIRTMFHPVLGAARFTTEITGATRPGTQDVKIYCDQRRIVKGIDTDPDLHDPTTATTTTPKPIDAAKENCAANFAFTRENTDTHPFWQITICPWFLKYAMEENLKFDQTILTGVWAKMAKYMFKGATKFKFRYTEIDATSMFHTTILHEFTHAHTGTHTATIDVGESNGYRWKNCLTKVAHLVTDDEIPHVVSGPECNADTWALYATASRLIATGHTVTATGQVIKSVVAPVSNAARAVGVKQILQDADQK